MKKLLLAIVLTFICGICSAETWMSLQLDNITYTESFNFVSVNEIIVKTNHVENDTTITRVYVKVTGEQNQSRVYYFDCNPVDIKSVTQYNSMLATMYSLKKSSAPVFKLISGSVAYKIDGVSIIDCP